MVQIDQDGGRRTVRLNDWVAILGLVVAVLFPAAAAVASVFYAAGEIKAELRAGNEHDRRQDQRIDTLENRVFESRSYR